MQDFTALNTSKTYLICKVDKMVLEQLTGWILSLAVSYGPWGIFIGMFLESSILPIPSELVLVTAGLAGVPIWEIVLFGTIGSTLGSIVGYYIGHRGRPLMKRYGKYILITDKRLKKSEKWFKRYGDWTILISRLIPFVPYKIFSITSGVLRMNLKKFVLFTFIGTIPRAFILAWIGSLLVGLEAEFLIGIVAAFIVGYLIYHFRKKFSRRTTKKK